jgi:MFS family permease
VSHGVLVGAVVMVLTQAVMVAIMTMTPVHMHDHGHGTTAAGAVIALHVAAMYLPSPITGRLVDRVGRSRMAVASGVTLLIAGLLAAAAPDDSVVLLALALALLGLGWNFGLVSGTAIITDAVPLETRARTQGLVDVSIAIAGAGGGLMSGVVVEMAGYSVLSFAGGLLALAILPAIAASARPRARLATS